MDSVAKQSGSSRDSGCFSVCQLLCCEVFLAGIRLSFTRAIWRCLQCDATCLAHLTVFFFFLIQIIHGPGCANFIESRAFLQSSHGCNYKLHTVAWLVELTYGHVVFICAEFVGWPCCKWKDVKVASG